MFDARFPVRVLSDGRWHRVAMAVSAGSLALYVDCVLVEDVKWGYPGMDISTDSLLVVGGIIEDSEIPFEVGAVHLTFTHCADRTSKQPLSKCWQPIRALFILIAFPALDSLLLNPYHFHSLYVIATH